MAAEAGCDMNLSLGAGATKVYVTLHAVERYIQRVNPAASVSKARDTIREQLFSSARQRERTRSGDTYFVGPDFRLVVAEERGSRTVLTVLPLDDFTEEQEIPELAAALNAEFVEWEASRQVQPGDSGKLKTAALTRANEELSRGIARRTEQLKRQVAHAARMEQDREAMRKTIRAIAVELLQDDPAAAMEVIRREMPGLIEFLRSPTSSPPAQA